MKATIDIPDELYRKVKAKSALRGRPVREVAIDLFQRWVKGSKIEEIMVTQEKLPKAQNHPYPPWFGVFRKYAGNARGYHDMDSIHSSIFRGRAKEERK